MIGAHIFPSYHLNIRLAASMLAGDPVASFLCVLAYPFFKTAFPFL